MDRRQLEATERENRRERRDRFREEDMRRRLLQDNIERINRQRQALIEQRMQTLTQPLRSFEHLDDTAERDLNVMARQSSSVWDEVETTDIDESVFLREDPLHSLQTEMNRLQKEIEKEKEGRRRRADEAVVFEDLSRRQNVVRDGELTRIEKERQLLQKEMQLESDRGRKDREEGYRTGAIRKTVSDTSERYKGESEELMKLQLRMEHELEELHRKEKVFAQETESLSKTTQSKYQGDLGEFQRAVKGKAGEGGIVMEKDPYSKTADRSVAEKDINQKKDSERDNVSSIIDREIRELDAKLSQLKSDGNFTRETGIASVVPQGTVNRSETDLFEIERRQYEAEIMALRQQLSGLGTTVNRNTQGRDISGNINPQIKTQREAETKTSLPYRDTSVKYDGMCFDLNENIHSFDKGVETKVKETATSIPDLDKGEGLFSYPTNIQMKGQEYSLGYGKDRVRIKAESVYENEQKDREFIAPYYTDTNMLAMRDERERYERQRKRDIIMKAKEDALNRKEIELDRRLKMIEYQRELRKRQELMDPYEVELNSREKELEERFLKIKEREIQIEKMEQVFDIPVKVEKMDKDKQSQTPKGQNEIGNTNGSACLKVKEGTTNVAERNERDAEKDTTAQSTTETKHNNRKEGSQEILTSEKETAGPEKNLFYPKFSAFSGEEPKPKGEASYEEWRYEVKCTQKDDLHSDQTIAQAIRKSFRGQAKRVLLPLGATSKVNEILKRSEGVFGNVATGESVLQEFYTASQKQDESVAAWGLRLEEILEKAVDKGHVKSEEKNDMLRNKFWKALRSDRLKNATRTHFATITDFEQLRKAVRAEECEMKVNSTAQHQSITPKINEDSIKGEDSKLDLLFKKLGALEQQIQDLNRQRNRQWQQRRWQGPRKGPSDPIKKEETGKKEETIKKDLN